MIAAELEKENVELKARNQELLQSCEGAIMMYKELIQAKELIQEIVANKTVLEVSNPYADYDTLKSLERSLEHWFQRAEVFLSSSKIDKEAEE